MTTDQSDGADRRETEDTLRPCLPKAAEQPLRECEAPRMVDADVYHESKEDMAAAQQAMEEYEAKGIEGAIPYSQYRSKRLGLES